MSQALIRTLKLAAVFAIVALVLIGTAYVLDLVEDESARETLEKTMLVLGIFTGGAVGIVLLAGGRSSSS